ncbi:MAG: CC0125/CC1285 family lipoprotein [Syntrophales bacterium]
MKVNRVLMIMAITFLMMSCAYPPTGYWKLGVGDPYTGYSETQIQKDMFQVSYKCNDATTYDAMKGLLAYRCAEITLQNGYDYFIVIEEKDITTEDYWGTVPGGRRRYDAPLQTVNAPGATVLIKLKGGKKPEEDVKAFDAREILTHVGPKIKQPVK